MARLDALVRCYRCNAQYDGESQWWRGLRGRNDATTLIDPIVWGSKVKMGHCPRCNRPPQLEPRPVQHAM